MQLFEERTNFFFFFKCKQLHEFLLDIFLTHKNGIISTAFFLYSRFLLVINFIHISVYMSIPIAQFSTPPSPLHCGFPPSVSIHLFSTSVSQILPCKPVHLYHFSRFHIHMLIHDICFSLSDLPHSV